VSVVVQDSSLSPAARLPLLRGPLERPFAWRAGACLSAADFLADVTVLARSLPAGRAAVNLCEDRYAFLVAFCALAVRGGMSLLPPARTPQAVTEVLAAHPEAYVLSEAEWHPAPPRLHRFALSTGPRDTPVAVPAIDANQVVAIGYTSGSTGTPKANPKQWGQVCRSTARNADLLRLDDFAAPCHLLATVPPQHMYGLETSVLLPLLGACAVATARPLFPADIARELAALPAPRLLVTTPVHLRALAGEGLALPPLRAIVSATAPLSQNLAQAAEALAQAPLIELFGSTETCVIAHRRTARDDAWTLYEGLALRPQPDGTLVEGDQMAAPVALADIVDLLPNRQFRLCGRNADLLEIAGKRASLGDLTRRLLAVSGVEDGVVFQLDADSAGVRRVAALVVAPSRTEAELLAALRLGVDPAFLPRPLKRVAELPRNETGKLPRAALLAALSAA
jgi:acyl-coenzyme A synthetase/AMP-(fatty) acid ligase